MHVPNTRPSNSQIPLAQSEEKGDESDVSQVASKAFSVMPPLQEVLEPVQHGDHFVLTRTTHSQAYDRFDQLLDQQVILAPRYKKTKIAWPTISCSLREALQGMCYFLSDSRSAAQFHIVPVRSILLKGSALTDIVCGKAKSGSDTDITLICAFAQEGELVEKQYEWITFALSAFLYNKIMQDSSVGPQVKKQINDYYIADGIERQIMKNRQALCSIYPSTRTFFGSKWDLNSSSGVRITLADCIDLTLIHRQRDPTSISYRNALCADISANVYNPNAPIYLSMSKECLKKAIHCLKRGRFEVNCRETIVGPRRFFKLAREMSRHLNELDEPSAQIAFNEFKLSCSDLKEFKKQLSRFLKSHFKGHPKRKVLFLIHLRMLLHRFAFKANSFAPHDAFILSYLQKLVHSKDAEVIGLSVDLWMLSVFAAVPFDFRRWVLPAAAGIKGVVCARESNGHLGTLYPYLNVMDFLPRSLQLLQFSTPKRTEVAKGVIALEHFMRETREANYVLDRGVGGKELDHWVKSIFEKISIFLQAADQLPLDQKEVYIHQAHAFFENLAPIANGEICQIWVENGIEFIDWIPIDAYLSFLNRAEKSFEESYFPVRVRIYLLMLSRGEIGFANEWFTQLQQENPSRHMATQAISDLFRIVNRGMLSLHQSIKLFFWLREQLRLEKPFITHQRAYRTFVMHLISSVQDLSKAHQRDLLYIIMTDFDRLASSQDTNVYAVIEAIKDPLFVMHLERWDVLREFLLQSDQGQELITQWNLMLVKPQKISKNDRTLFFTNLDALRFKQRELTPTSRDLFFCAFKRFAFKEQCKMIRFYCELYKISPCTVEEFQEVFKSSLEKSERAKNKIFNEVLHFKEPRFSLWFLEQGTYSKKLEGRIVENWSSLGVDDAIAFERNQGKVVESALYKRLAKQGNRRRIEEAARGWVRFFLNSEMYSKSSAEASAVHLLIVLKNSFNKIGEIVSSIIYMGEELTELITESPGEDRGELSLAFCLLQVVVSKELRKKEYKQKVLNYFSLVTKKIVHFQPHKEPKEIWKKQLYPTYFHFLVAYPELTLQDQMEVEGVYIEALFKGTMAQYWMGWEQLKKNEISLLNNSPEIADRIVQAVIEGSERILFHPKTGLYQELESEIKLLAKLADQNTAAPQPLQGMEAEAKRLQESIRTNQRMFSHFCPKIVGWISEWIASKQCSSEMLLQKYEIFFPKMTALLLSITINRRLADRVIQKIVIPLSANFSINPQIANRAQKEMLLRLLYIPLMARLILQKKNNPPFASAALLVQALYYFPEIKAGAPLEEVGNQMRNALQQGFYRYEPNLPKEGASFDYLTPFLNFLRLDMYPREGLFARENFSSILNHLFRAAESIQFESSLRISLRALSIYYALSLRQDPEPARRWSETPIFQLSKRGWEEIIENPRSFKSIEKFTDLCIAAEDEGIDRDLCHFLHTISMYHETHELTSNFLAAREKTIKAELLLLLVPEVYTLDPYPQSPQIPLHLMNLIEVLASRKEEQGNTISLIELYYRLCIFTRNNPQFEGKIDFFGRVLVQDLGLLQNGQLEMDSFVSRLNIVFNKISLLMEIPGSRSISAKISLLQTVLADCGAGLGYSKNSRVARHKDIAFILVSLGNNVLYYFNFFKRDLDPSIKHDKESLELMQQINESFNQYLINLFFSEPKKSLPIWKVIQLEELRARLLDSDQYFSKYVKSWMLWVIKRLDQVLGSVSSASGKIALEEKRESDQPLKGHLLLEQIIEVMQ